MKNTYLFGALLACSLFTTQAQVLDVNNVGAGIFSNGALFFNGSASTFEVPRGSGKTTVFASHLWFGGYSGGQLHVAAQTYAQPVEGGQAYNYGPVTDSGAYTQVQLLNTFNRVVKITKTQVADHRTRYADAGYTPAAPITQWLGSGDTTKGVSPVLAPFHDSNGDGYYTPLQGDFPVINGDGALQAVYSDNRITKETGNRRLDLNIMVQAWAVNSTTDSALNNTLFLRYRLHNVSGRNYDSLFLAHWSDLDIGNYVDDFVGSDSARSLFYGYNATNTDDPAQGGYGANPPAQAVMFLSHPMNRFIYYNNDSSAIGNPNTYLAKYNYMRGVGLNGQPLPQRYMFGGDPVAGTGSNEVTLGNAAGDRRGLGTMAPINLPAGASICVDFAYVFGRGSSNLNSITVMRERADAIRSWYNSQNLNCSGLFSSVSEEPATLEVKAFPNPFNNSLHLSLSQPATAGSVAYLYDLSGRRVGSFPLATGETQLELQAEVAPGMYLLQLTQAGSTHSLRVVKH